MEWYHSTSLKSPFVSCKKMKDDIKDLQNHVNDLQKQNDTLKDKNSDLEGQTDGVANIIGYNEPITATTTFLDNNGNTKTVSGTYKFKTSDYSSQSMIKRTGGTYDIYLDRYSNVEGGDRAWVRFTYNPTTKAVTNLSANHNWNDADSYSNRARYYSGYTGVTVNVTVDSLNLTTGATSIKFSGAGTSDYTNAYPSYAPNPGKPVSTNFSFVGKLKLFSQD